MAPEGWQRINMGDVCERVTDGSHQSVPAADDGDVPFLFVSCVRDGKILWENAKYISRQIYEEIGRGREPEPGDVLYTAVGSYGHAALIRKPCEFSFQRHIAFIRPDRAHVTPEFLAQWLNSPPSRRHADLVAVGNAQKTVTLGKLKEFPLFLPPLSEQRKIAAILSSVDEAIEGTQAVIDQLQVVKKAMMADLLTRGIPGRHKTFKQTDLGKIPAEWEVVRLGEHLREPIRNGYSPVCPTSPTGKWILHVGAVTFDGYSPEGIKPAPLNDSRVDSATLEPGDLIVSRSNTRERVGLAGIYSGSPSPCSYPDLLMRVRVADRVRVRYLEVVLLSEIGRAYLSSSARGTSASMVKINRETLESFSFPLPSLPEQDAIISALAAVKDASLAERRNHEALVGLRSALMSVLLTGEVRVCPDGESA